MRLIVLTTLALALSAGCSQRKSDLQQARTARSVLAEWALLAEMRVRLPDVYVRQMREEAQAELGTVVASARQAGTQAARATAAAADIQGDPPPALLQARVRALLAIERSLEAR